uniref:Uncharacterized protein n=1 Tax=Rhizophora mucronata TaxID=61149 RepID=A0A2P2N2S6_RHIMU
MLPAKVVTLSPQKNSRKNEIF